jgi:hypothetical protein
VSSEIPVSAPALDMVTDLPPLPATIRVSRVLDKLFTLLRDHFWLIYGITLVVYVPFFFYNLAVRQLQVSIMQGGSPFFMRSEVLLFLLLAFTIFMIAWIFIWPLGTMAATSAVARSYLRQPTSVPRAYREVLRLLLPAIGLMLLVGLLVGLGSMLCLVPGIYLMLRLYVVFPALVVERQGAFDSMARSAELVRGNYWRILAIIIVAGCVKAALVYSITFAGAAFFSGPSLVHVMLYSLSQFLGQLFVAPFDFILAVVIYFELREVKEGLDLELLGDELARSRRTGALQASGS